MSTTTTTATATQRSSAARCRALPLACLVGALLPACGGGESDIVADTLATVATVTAPSVDFRRESDDAPGDRPGHSPADDGPLALDPARSSVPVDTAARTRRGLYLSRALAERAMDENPGQVVWVDADCCAAAARADNGHGHDLAVLLAFAAQAAQNLGTDAPFFVVGRDLRAAARLADRLAETGARNTYLITP